MHAARRAAYPLLASALLLVTGLGLRAASPPATALLEDVMDLVDGGRFAQAERLIAQAGEGGSLTDELAFQRERMRRIRLDFSLDESGLRAAVRRQIPDLREDEFRRWTASNQLEHMVIDGTPYYFNRSVSNLFRVSPEALARRATPFQRNDGPMETANAYHDEAVAEARASGKTSVAPRRVRVTQSITVNPDAVPAGETVRAWIPYPRALPGRQEDIRFLASTPSRHEIAPEATKQRTVYLERPAVAGQPTTFSISYELTIFGQHHRIDPDKVGIRVERGDAVSLLEIDIEISTLTQHLLQRRSPEHDFRHAELR